MDDDRKISVAIRGQVKKNNNFNLRSSSQNSAVQSTLSSNKAYIGLSDTATEVSASFAAFFVFLIAVAVFVPIVPNPPVGEKGSGQLGQVPFFRKSEMCGNAYVYSFFSRKQ